MRFRSGADKTPKVMRCQKLFSIASVLQALLVLGIGLSSAARAAPMDDLPMLGDASSGIVSREMEARIGEDFMRQIRSQLPTHGDPLLLYWMEQLLFDLAAASDLRDPSLHLVMVDSGQINAFAAPGGIVGINLGNFVAGQTVHEFAAIVAHELAHLSQRHFARGIEAQQRMTLPYVAAMIASAAIMATIGADAGMAAMASSQAAMQDSMLRYSRAREREADRVGIETMQRAGMDPWAMAGMFERMTRAARYSRRPPEFLLTHPVTESRIADARDRASQYPRKTIPDTLDYQLMRARVQLHLAESASSMVTTFRIQLEEGRTGFPDAARYGLALAQLRHGQPEAAAETLAPLVEAEPHRIAYVLAEVDIALERGQTDLAISNLERLLLLNPGNLPLTMAYAHALNRAQRHLEAQSALERLAIRRPADAQVWYELAETAGLAGDIIAVHRARAEYFQLHGNLQHALQHLQYALQLVTDNFPLTARLNQRVQDIREIRQRIAG